MTGEPGTGETTWGVNIGGFIKAHPDWQITGRSTGSGWSARRRVDGRPKGPKIEALSLDELAAKIKAAP